MGESEVTLRKYHRTILRYTCLHHFEPAAKRLLQDAASRADPVGRLARTLLALRSSVRQSPARRLAFSSFYALVRQPQLRAELRNRFDHIWADLLVSAKDLCPDHRNDIERYLREWRKGKASVYGSRWGKGRLASKFLDDPGMCLLRKKELRGMLRKMELQMVRAYLDKGLFGGRKIKRVLRRAFRKELRAMEAAIDTHHHHRSHQCASSQNHWRQWYREQQQMQECVQNCHRLHHRQQPQQLQSVASPSHGADGSDQFNDWLQSVQYQLSSNETDQSGQQQQQQQNEVHHSYIIMAVQHPEGANSTQPDLLSTNASATAGASIPGASGPSDQSAIIFEQENHIFEH